MSEPSRKQQLYSKPSPGALLALFGVLGVALALRLWGLGRESLWLDEATSLKLARMPVATLVAWTAQDIHPPLYYVLLHFWRVLGESEVALRGLSVLAGVLGVGLTYFLGQQLFDEWVGLAGALLLAVAPLHIWYSQEVRGYAWLTSFGLLALYGVARLVVGVSSSARKGEALAWGAYILGATAAWYVHYYAVFIILAANAVVVATVLRRRRPLAFLVPWAVAQVAILILYLPWMPAFLRPILTGSGGWVAEIGSPTPSTLSTTMVSFIVGGAQPWLPVLLRRPTYLAFMVALGLGVAWGVWPGKDEEARRRRDGVLLAALYFALPVGTAWLISQLKPLFAWRYLVPFLPPFLILVGRGAMIFRRVVLRLLALAVLLVAPLWATAEQVRHLENPDWRGLALQLLAEARPGDVITFMPGWNEKPLDYYLRGRIPIGDYVPEPLSPAATEHALRVIDRTMVAYRRIWLLWAKGHYTDPNGIIASYLDQHARRVQERTVPGVGELILYDLDRK